MGFSPQANQATERQITFYQIRFEVSTAVTMNAAVFWDVAQCCSCENGRFGGTCRLHHRGEMNQKAKKNISSN
jgi:hypothetical protein